MIKLAAKKSKLKRCTYFDSLTIYIGDKVIKLAAKKSKLKRCTYFDSYLYWR